MYSSKKIARLGALAREPRKMPEFSYQPALLPSGTNPNDLANLMKQPEQLQPGTYMMPPQMPQQMPQPSQNMGGQYRLSPGVYGNREQAMEQWKNAQRTMSSPVMDRRFEGL